MKKRLLGTLLAAVLVVASTVTAFAVGSKTAAFTVVGDSAGVYDVEEIDDEDFKELAEEKPEVLNVIKAINEGRAAVDIIAEQAPELKEQLEGKSLVSKFVNLIPLENATRTADGRYQPTLSVPGLTDAMSDVQVLHYSTVRNVWEIITPSNVDMENKQITVEFLDLSPVAVIANVDADKAANAIEGTSPKTGVESGWGMFMGMAVIILGAAVVVFRKTRENA